MNVSLISVSPDAEKHMAYCARVSNPNNQENENYAGLLRYCIKHQHWSIFEQAFMTLEINTTRGLAAQILILKQNGWNIVTTMRQVGNVTWAEYWLEERFRREHKQATDFNLANSGEDMPLPKAFFKQEREHYENISNDPYEWAEEGH